MSNLRKALDKKRSKLATHHPRLSDIENIEDRLLYRAAFNDGFNAATEILLPLIEELRTALERLTKIGPPSKPTTGLEYAEVALVDNCNLAKEALSKLEEFEKQVMG